MVLQTYIAPLVCLIGLLVWALSDKFKPLGIVAFAAGLLASLLMLFGSHPFRF